MVPPTIDTSVARTLYSASSKSAGLPYRKASPLGTRARTLSSASTSSSISLVTPVPSSGNPSSSSLNLPFSNDQRAGSGAFAAASEEGTAYSDEEEDMPLFVRALHDFVPQQQNATCLAFCAGETIRVLNRDQSGWWDGEINGRRGWFPSNYVGSVDDSEPATAIPMMVHTRSMSDATFASRASTASPMHRLSNESSGDYLYPASPSHTPPLMVPLLHGLQLLQNTTRARRLSHYQPAVACIIQCIRALLQQTDCLARGGPLLHRFPVLAQERKRVLADLALLVTQSKKASSVEFQSDEEREPEEELMLRLAGQVFARVRRFLAVVVQCGLDLPERSFASTADTSASETVYENSIVLPPKEPESIRSQYGFNTDDEIYYPAQTPKSAELDRKHHNSSLSMESSSTKRSSKHSSRMSVSLSGSLARQRFHGRQMSLSSTSSFSSFSSSLESPGTPPTPAFPEGPCTALQVQQALRSTHDSLLSTIAAFIGHVHTHSRAAHASSTGHLFALVRQIVDVVCRLLTVVDAVMCVESIPEIKRAALELAKERLYLVACALADAVREMATSTNVSPSEEEAERGRLLKVATDALKAGSDCVSAVKTCLALPLNARPYIIVLPSLTDAGASPPVESKDNDSCEQTANSYLDFDKDDEWPADEDVKRASIASGGTILPETLDELHEQVQLEYATTSTDYDFDTEEVTVHSLKQPSRDGRTPNHPYFIDEEYSPPSSPLPERDRQSFIAALSMDFADTIEEEIDEDDRSSSERDLPSPTSQTHASMVSTDDGTLWEGRQRQKSLEDKLFHGELPSIPQATDEDGIPLAWTLSHDYAPEDVAYNSDGQLVGATLEALVEKMTPHDQIGDSSFTADFFLTFRLFTTPSGLVEAIAARFNLKQPSGLSDEDAVLWSQQKLLPVRLRVQKLLKSWLEMYWRPGTDNEAVPALQSFVRGTMAEVFSAQAQRLDDLITTRSTASADQPYSPISERQRLSERFPSTAMSINQSLVSGSSSSETPRPIMTKALLASLRAQNFASIPVTDFDALELARQMTLVESELYSAITPEEMIELGMPGAPPAVNVKAVSALSTAITGWVSESILGEQDVKRRALLIKFFIKVADRCTSLNNFSTPRSILAALDSSTISRLHQTWSGLAQKSKIQMEALRKLADHARNYHEYRSRLRSTSPPAVPFLGLYLTDLTFCREGNPSHRASPLVPSKKLLNFNKYHKLARIIQDMQHFQHPAYNLKDVAEAKQYLQFCLDKAKDHSDLDDLYRRSQLLEPKRAAEAPSGGELKPSIFGWGNRSQASSSQAMLA